MSDKLVELAKKLAPRVALALLCVGIALALTYQCYGT